MMEDGPFIHDPEISSLLRDSFIESRLHTDAHTEYSETVIRELQDRYADGNRAQPIYVAIDPLTGRALARLFGADQAGFLPFLKQALAARAQ
ncbi:MAG TPA: hypothetical protein VK081_01410 [Planctomycetota bacterium]|nr:hypothetical protein [Planctomycetota bacterium]